MVKDLVIPSDCPAALDLVTDYINRSNLKNVGINYNLEALSEFEYGYLTEIASLIVSENSKLSKKKGKR